MGDKKVLYFTRHTVYTLNALPSPLKPLKGPSLSDQVMVEIGEKGGFAVDCTRNGEVFDGDLSTYGAFVFFSSGSLQQLMGTESTQGSPSISERGKARFFQALVEGAGFVGLRNAVSCSQDIIGCSYNGHAPTQEGRMVVKSPNFPGLENAAESFAIRDPWYTFKAFKKDTHVILAQDTEVAKKAEVPPERQEMHQKILRPPYPATWARVNGKSRVFYTSMGNFDETWTNPIFQEMMLGAIGWTMGLVDADVSPNIDWATPQANQTQW